MNFEWIDEIESVVFMVTDFGRIDYANNRACRLLHYKKAEIIGLDLNDLLTDSGNLLSDLADTFRPENNFIVLKNIRFIGKDGEKHLTHATVLRIEQSESQLYLLLCHSQKEKSQRGLSDERRLRDFQIQTLGRMTEGLSNDLRNIFGIIGGYTEMAQENISGCSEIKNDLREILGACDRGKKNLNIINAFARKNKTVNIYFDLERHLTATVHTIKATLPQNIILKYVSVVEESLISADPGKLDQLLLGICLALGSSDNGLNLKGLITITLNNTVSSRKLHTEERSVQILIQSDRIELDARFIELFNSYDEKLLPGNSELESILLVARRILSALNGEIFIDSSEKDRNAVAILFPIVDKRAISKPAFSGPPSGNGQHVLVVDDEVQVAVLTESRLKKLNYQVTIKTHSREALEYFTRNLEKYSLIIIDQVMPELSGLDLAKAILKIKPNLPIVMISGYTSGITEKKCRECGVKYLAMKPIDENELATVVDKAIRRD